MNDSDPSEAVLAALAIVGIFIAPVVGFVVIRYLAHRERMEMIRHGIVPPVRMRGRDWRRAAESEFAAGMPGMPPGFAAQPPKAPSRKSCEPDFSVAGQRVVLQKGVRLAFIGLALTIGLSFIGFHDDGFRPGPWLLGGLIPMFVGLAQIVSAMLGGATFGPAYGLGYGQQPHRDVPFVEPPFAPPPHAAPPTYDASYTYRPGDTQELRPPPMPPDRR